MDTPPKKRDDADSRRLGPYGRQQQRRLRLEARAARATARRIARLPRIDAEEKRERACERRLAQRVRLREATRRGAIAAFILDAAREAGVSVGVAAVPRSSPSVHVWAPSAPTELECEASFRAAVSRHLSALVLFAAESAGRA